MNQVGDALAIFSESAGVIAFLLQVHKTHTTKNKYGISVWTTVLVGASEIGWLVYAFAESIWQLIISSIITSVLSAYLIYLISQTKRRRYLYSLMLICGVALGLTFEFGPAELAGWVALIFLTLSLLPQIKKAFTDKRIDGLDEGSLYAWLIVSFATIAYSLIFDALPIVISGFVGIAYSVIVITLFRRKSTRHKKRK